MICFQVQCDDLSTSGFQSESESLFSSDREEEFPDDSDNDANFIPPTDMDTDTSDNDTDSKQTKVVPQLPVTVISESEESQDSFVFPYLTQKPDPKATFEYKTGPKRGCIQRHNYCSVNRRERGLVLWETTQTVAKTFGFDSWR